jgi:predicted lipoprotein with Yx(FWY)xxD motif
MAQIPCTAPSGSMRRALSLLSLSLATSLTLAACGSSSSGSAATTGSATPAAVVVRTASSPALKATVLTNAAGMTLYSLSAEQNGKFICTNTACTQVWHALSPPASGAPAGIASLGTVTRPDGTKQVTYKGLPLYTFAQDQHSGEANGQGVKDVGTWSAVTVAAAAPAAGGSSTSSTTAPAGRSGY